MTVVLALTKLFGDVVAQFKADAIAVPNVFGWRAHLKQWEAVDRICWMPGDVSGNAGAILPPKYPGRIDPGRPLATLDELCTVDIMGSNRGQPDNELAQYQASRELYDKWYRAVYLSARGTFRVLSTAWIVTKDEGRIGATLRVVLAVQSMIQDQAPTQAPVDAHASITTSVLDEDETQTIQPSGAVT